MWSYGLDPKTITFPVVKVVVSRERTCYLLKCIIIFEV